MSKHETALALIDEQIERLEKDRGQANGKVALARGTLERAEKEVKLIDYSLGELQASRKLLTSNRIVIEPRGSMEERMGEVPHL